MSTWQRAFVTGAIAGIFAINVQAHTVCYGSNCPPPENSGLGMDFYELYGQLGAGDRVLAGLQWQTVTGTSIETRQQCVARCEQAYRADLQLCIDASGAQTEGEDPWVTQSRVNCFEAMRQQQIRCLAPAQLLNCPAG